ncbi:MAG: hypothetical protein AAGA30_01805 [Planctomycetota bacterium]
MLVQCRFFILVLVLAPVALLSLVSGCGSDKLAEQARASSEFLLASAPATKQTIGTAQKSVDSQPEVVIEGWVDLKALEAKNNKAVFMLREILEDSDHGGSNHDPSSCPFCKRRMEAAPKAAIAFRGEDNKIIEKDVAALLPIEHGDIVIIKGTGKMPKDSKILQVTASGIFLTKK